VPDIWYIVHLKAPDGRGKDLRCPGVPLVIIGHNQRIAWGFTNSTADVQDGVSGNDQRARFYEISGSRQLVQAKIRPEVIHVKGQPDETENVFDHPSRSPIVENDKEDTGHTRCAGR